MNIKCNDLSISVLSVRFAFESTGHNTHTHAHWLIIAPMFARLYAMDSVCVCDACTCVSITQISIREFLLQTVVLRKCVAMSFV